ncbi:hypothetical protein N7509_006807 [Penicillium cosmopolitanum]|uniref:NYN domain-containing protein n=1 Tax=Penicillium cosmopolitanum TaxID=1131564 RepID=A0A9W9VXN9_9EURO|nr:uncharacterized protein N7509_006807 [Penicillium cosmopolitanum]KAJ5391317.1 hypothetical protein N7509_006807 [Penicillium cosmopolitanum]
MPVTDPTEPASNWDFTPVFDLLRSSTHNGSSDTHGHNHSGAVPSPSESRQQPDVQTFSQSSRGLSRPQPDPHGLGDFGSLWDIINRDSNSFRTLESRQPTIPVPTGHQPYVQLRPPITILKRGHTDPNKSHTSSAPIPVPGTSKCNLTSRAATGTSLSSSRDPASKGSKQSSSTIKSYDTAPQATPETSLEEVNGIKNAPRTPEARGSNMYEGSKPKETLETISSEGSDEVDSDSHPTVFDRPYSWRPNHLAFTPGQLGTPDARHGRYETPPSSFDEKESTLKSENVKNFITTSAGIRVLPVDYKSATERRIGLMTKLLKDFPEYAQLVSRVGHSPKPTQNNVQSRPIHVFVDMSNIMVGFHDSVKVSRNIPISTRIRRLHMSFANFSLIMERGRPASKRVLVGSDQLPSINEAKTLGYEANILERVHKAKHATPRHTKFRKAPGNTTQHGNGGPETVNASNERWVEQGVDEILHLKILESLVDTDEPATIVLATGDAAVAEYSEGFMRMVERALQRGWTVELVSFSQVTSYSYRKKEFRDKWQDSFQLVELDSYVEELFE